MSPLNLPSHVVHKNGVTLCFRLNHLKVSKWPRGQIGGPPAPNRCHPWICYQILCGKIGGPPAPNRCHPSICYQILCGKMVSHFVLAQSLSKLVHVKNVKNNFFENVFWTPSQKVLKILKYQMIVHVVRFQKWYHRWCYLSQWLNNCHLKSLW